MFFHDLGPDDFGSAFSFTRPVEADYRDAAGVVQTAPVNSARFDHDAEGHPLGLLVTAGEEMGQSDRALLTEGQLPADILTQDVTVFHERVVEGGTERRAWFSRNATATVDAIMNMEGHHLSIGVIAGFRENKGGLVRYRGENWYLIGLIAAGDGAVLADAADLPLIGG